MDQTIAYILDKLDWLHSRQIWPNGMRYLWTDAFGVVLYVSLYENLDDKAYLDSAEQLVGEVDRVLGRPRGIRIGEAADRDGQYFHYIAMWLYALAMLGNHIDDYRQKGIEIVRQIHARFLVPGHGVIWKMQEDLSGPYPGFGFGAMDAFDGYISYRQLDSDALSQEITDMRVLIDKNYEDLIITQDLGLGMMLWLSHFYPDEAWAISQRQRCLQILDGMWRPEGFFSREPYLPDTRIAFTNYGVSIGLQAVRQMPSRVSELMRYFETYRADDDYDDAAITHVMACSSRFPGCLLK